VNERQRAQLEDLRSKPKFVDEPGTIYNGMRPECDRQAAENQVRKLIDRLLADSEPAPDRRAVLAAVAGALKAFPGSDTEDCDRMCRYMREILDVLGIESSGGLLMRWRYGWLLGTFVTLTGRTRR
jgi:Domain of unknown function (DUF4844)